MPALNARATVPATAWLEMPEAGTAEARVRTWLAEQNGLHAEQIRFERDSAGRPNLQPPLTHLDCNWSHSGSHLLVACVENARIGVDTEWIRPRRSIEEIAARYFTEAEQAWLAGLNTEEKVHGFHRLWCCKEALLKAHGRGIAFGLDRFEVLPAANGCMQIQALDPALGTIDQWQLKEWIPASGYVAALAVFRR